MKDFSPPVDPSSVEAFKEDAECKEFQADADVTAALASTPKLSDVDTSAFGIVFFAGGHGACWDFTDASVSPAIEAAWKAGSVVASVCHGPACLVTAEVDGEPLIKGKKFACFTDDEERAMSLESVVPHLLQSKLEELGGTSEPAANWACQVVTDGKLVTGQNPASAGETARASLAAASA